MTGALADPVAGKELRSVSRRWQTYVGRILFVAVTGCLIYSFWSQAWRPGRPVAVSAYAALSRDLFVRCEAVALVLTVLAAVIAAADMISREIRNGTLGLMLLTPLTPWKVVFGKWKGAMMIALSFYLCCVPILAMAVYLGGAGPADLARSIVFTVGLTGVGAAVALRLSARMRSPVAAAATALPITFWWYGVFLVADHYGNAMQRSVIHEGGVMTTMVAAAVCAMFLVRTMLIVRERSGILPGPEELSREQRALRADDARERHASPPLRMLANWRSVWQDNPLLWKEFTLRPALRISEAYRTWGYAGLAVLFLSTWIATGGGEAFFYPWALFFTVAALVGGSLLFAPEKENRQWMLLLSTPVTAAQIVHAKLLCGLLFPEAAGLILLYLLSLPIWIGWQPASTMITLGFAATLFILFAYSLAAAASLRAKTARNAFLFSATVVALLVAAPPFLATALRTSLGTPAHEVMTWIQALSPATVLSSLNLEGITTPVRARAGDLLLRYFVLYLPLTLMLPLEMVLRFRRIAIRA